MLCACEKKQKKVLTKVLTYVMAHDIVRITNVTTNVKRVSMIARRGPTGTNTIRANQLEKNEKTNKRIVIYKPVLIN